MMLWFLRHIDQHLEWRGMKVLTYRYWHPRDHIFFKRGSPRPYAGSSCEARLSGVGNWLISKRKRRAPSAGSARGDIPTGHRPEQPAPSRGESLLKPHDTRERDGARTREIRYSVDRRHEAGRITIEAGQRERLRITVCQACAWNADFGDRLHEKAAGTEGAGIPLLAVRIRGRALRV